MKIKLTAFNISLYFAFLFIVRGYQTRGYFAIGGEWLLPIMGIVIHYLMKDIKKIKGEK